MPICIGKIICFFLGHEWVIYDSAVWDIPKTVKMCEICKQKTGDIPVEIQEREVI